MSRRDDQHDSNLRDDQDDPILDVLLAEVLGGETPPDLSARILAAWESRCGSESRSSTVAGGTPVAEMPNGGVPPAGPRRPQPIPLPAKNGSHSQAPIVRPACDAAALEGSRGMRKRAFPRAAVWIPATLAAGVLLSVTGYLALKALPKAKDEPGPLARQETLKSAGEKATRPRDQQAGDRQTADTPQTDPAKAGNGMKGTAPVKPANRDESHGSLAQRERSASSQTAEPSAAGAKGELASSQPKTAQANQGQTAQASQAAEANAAAPAVAHKELPPVSSSDDDVIAYINALIRRQWADAGVVGSPAATDAEWCRRVYLDVIGRIPTVAETTQFVADRSHNKRLLLVNRLLESDDYVEEYARNWTNIWTNLLIGRSGGADPNGPVSRDGLQQYLRRSFLKNKPYDVFVAELISADGANTPGTEGFNGAVNFLLDNLNENATPATAKTARIFLGLQVQCTQCHNHPFNEGKQNQFWELNAFFRQAVALRTTEGRSVTSTRLADQDFAGEGNSGPDKADTYYELRNGLLKVAYPVFVDGTAIDPAGYVEKVNRRDELARLVVKSDYLGQEIVNRLWGHFLGYGFTKPVDDFGTHNLPSHPELLQRLARDFVGHGHDLKSLIRWITLSEAYGLSSRVGPKNEKDDPTKGERPLFSHFYLRQMRAEELYHSLVVASGADNTAGDYASQERAKSEWLNQFTIAFGTDDGGEATTFDGTIPQTLMMWNGELINRATSGQPGTLLHTVAMTDTMKPGAKINQLFTAALARKPTKSELQAANQLWQLRGGDSLAAMQDLWWAVLNSNEFILNH